MPETVIQQFASPPHSPEECIFALTTQTLSADLKTTITPCQFGGKPDCASCGCIASMGLASLGAYKLGGIVSLGTIFQASHKIGRHRAGVRAKTGNDFPVGSPLPILQLRDEKRGDRV
jgi:hypothetical protein